MARGILCIHIARISALICFYEAKLVEFKMLSLPEMTKEELMMSRVFENCAVKAGISGVLGYYISLLNVVCLSYE